MKHFPLYYQSGWCCLVFASGVPLYQWEELFSVTSRACMWWCQGQQTGQRSWPLRIQQVTLDRQRESIQIYRGRGDNVMTQGCYYSITCNDTGTLLQYYIYTLWSKLGPSHQCTIITLSLIESWQSMQACHKKNPRSPGTLVTSYNDINDTLKYYPIQWYNVTWNYST